MKGLRRANVKKETEEMKYRVRNVQVFTRKLLFSVQILRAYRDKVQTIKAKHLEVLSSEMDLAEIGII